MVLSSFMGRILLIDGVTPSFSPSSCHNPARGSGIRLTVPDQHFVGGAMLGDADQQEKSGFGTGAGKSGTDESWRKPFTEAEMKAARRALRDQEGVLAEALALLRKLARNLPFTEDALAAYHCVRDPETSARVRFILVAALAYLVMPIDAIPDVLPLLGFSDDAAVLATALATVRSAITPEHRAKARETLDDL
jgi:uncharacterized membrane protein YkvA (DUF1232 family)